MRFAFAAEEKNNWTLDVHFVPVGMNYSDRENFGGDYLANIGEPIRLADYRAQYEENPARAINELKKEIEKAMEKLAIHIPSETYYTETEWLREMAINDFVADRKNKTMQFEEFEAGSKAIAQSEKLFAQEDRAEEMVQKLKRYQDLIKKQNLRDRVFAPAYRAVSPIVYLLFFVLFFPVFVVGMIIHFLPSLLAQRATKKIVKDPAFNSSILWVIGTVLFSIVYVIMFLLIGLISGNWWYALASWPAGVVVGALTLWYKRRWNRFAAEQRFKKFARTKEGAEAMALRQEIMKALYAA